MSGDMHILGHILIDPPVTSEELVGAGAGTGYMEHIQLTDQLASGYGRATYPGVLIKTLGRTVEVTRPGQSMVFGYQRRVMEYVGVAIVGPDYESNGAGLLEDVQRIVNLFATTPDGRSRTFTGYLQCHWANEEVFRVVVDAGNVAREVRPMFPGVEDKLPPLPKGA